MTEQKPMANVFKTLKTERDELRLKIHLGKAELEDEWEELEAKWERFEGKISQVQKQAADSSEDLEAAIELLGEELKKAYGKIRSSL